MGPVEEVTGLKVILAKAELRCRDYKSDLRKVVTQSYLPTRLRRKVGIS